MLRKGPVIVEGIPPVFGIGQPAMFPDPKTHTLVTILGVRIHGSDRRVHRIAGGVAPDADFAELTGGTVQTAAIAVPGEAAKNEFHDSSRVECSAGAQ